MNREKRVKGTKEMVAEIFSAHPQWNAQQILDRLRILAGDPGRVPGLNAVQKAVAPLREEYKKFRDQDKPWSMGALTANPLNPEVLPTIVRLKSERDMRFGPSLSIREAKWASYLWPFVEEVRSRGMRISELALLDLLTRMYGKADIVSQLLGRPYPDTTKFDGWLVWDNLPSNLKGLLISFIEWESGSASESDAEWPEPERVGRLLERLFLFHKAKLSPLPANTKLSDDGWKAYCNLLADYGEKTVRNVTPPEAVREAEEKVFALLQKGDDTEEGKKAHEAAYSELCRLRADERMALNETIKKRDEIVAKYSAEVQNEGQHSQES